MAAASPRSLSLPERERLMMALATTSERLDASGCVGGDRKAIFRAIPQRIVTLTHAFASSPR